MDETPLWFEMPGVITVTHNGEQSIQTTSHDKEGFIVGHVAMADGTNLRPTAELQRDTVEL